MKVWWWEPNFGLFGSGGNGFWWAPLPTDRWRWHCAMCVRNMRRRWCVSVVYVEMVEIGWLMVLVGAVDYRQMVWILCDVCERKKLYRGRANKSRSTTQTSLTIKNKIIGKTTPNGPVASYMRSSFKTATNFSNEYRSFNQNFSEFTTRSHHKRICRSSVATSPCHDQYRRERI